MEKVDIRVTYREEALGTSFDDAIYYDNIQEYEKAVNNGSHQAEKKRRVDAWVDLIKNPPAPVEYTKEELLEKKRLLEDDRIAIESQIAEIQTKINAKEEVIK